MARFQRFNQATGGKTPQYLAAELRRSQLENEAINQQNAQQSSDIRGAIDLYDKGTGDNTPIMDGFSNMYDSMGEQKGFDGYAATPDMNARDAVPSDLSLDLGDVSQDPFNPQPVDAMGGEVSADPFSSGLDQVGIENQPLSAETTMPETGMSSGDVAEEGMWDKVKGIFGGGEEELASGISDASDLNGDINAAWDNIETADTASNAIESIDAIEGADAVTDIAGATEMVEGVSSAAEAAEAIDSVAGVASNIGLGGVAGALTAESTEEAALTLAMNTNPYTAAALALYKMIA